MNKSKYALGLMSGTSMDGIDAAIIETDGRQRIRSVANHYQAYHPCFQQLLKAAEYTLNQTQGDFFLAQESFDKHLKQFITKRLQQKADYIDTLENYFSTAFEKDLSLSGIETASTQLHLKAVLQLLKQAKLATNDIHIIGYHGQALFHNPAANISLQIGQPEFLAEHTGIPVVSNFREENVLLGGQGAPLAPLYHYALACRDQRLPAVVINCGGIANLSYIPDDDVANVIGFDVGPGNVLLDRYLYLKTQGELNHDKDGKLALVGRMQPDIIQALNIQLNDYKQQIYPKSLDSHDLELPDIVLSDQFSMEDTCASLASFTATCIADAVRSLNPPSDYQIILAGGGWHNPAILGFLKQALNAPMQLADEIHWQNDALEAECFAYLATRRLQNDVTCLASVTGATKDTSSGLITKAR